MKKFLFIFLVLISSVLYLLTTRGDLGTPTPHQIEYEMYQAGQPFETSQERARFASLLSIYHDKNINIDNYASMGTPDIGKIKGHYYSLFPPAVSILALPLYALGLQLGATQIAVFSLSTIFSILTMILIMHFALKIKLHWTIALFCALAFGFATNAWGYSVTLYAHLISGFLILLAYYLTTFLEGKWKYLKILSVWVIYSLAVFVDFPNLFIFLPIVILLMVKGFVLNKNDQTYKLSFDWRFAIFPFVFIGSMLLYGYYNNYFFGSPTQLSNALPRVQDLKDTSRAIPETGKDAFSILNPRLMLEGFKTFIISHDRGLMIYTPIALLSALGLGFLKEKRQLIEIGLLAVPVTCLILYTLFADPYGGWAFGSRYMIAILPELILLVGIGLARFSKNILVKILFTGVFIYSAAISLMAPLTTNVIPPSIEAESFGLQSWYIINIKMLSANELNSFVYNHIINAAISGWTYYGIILSIVIFLGVFLIWYPKKKYEHI